MAKIDVESLIKFAEKSGLPMKCPICNSKVKAKKVIKFVNKISHSAIKHIEERYNLIKK